MHPNEWKQKGKIYLWRYEGNPKDYIGWHLHCDKEGVRSLVELIKSLSGANDQAQRTVKLAEPTASVLCVPNCRAKCVSYSRLVLGQSNEWGISVVDSKIHFLFSSNLVDELICGIQGISKQSGDYFIGTRNNELWFWW